jgi:predicted aldo/keto reductase-like oxidoreductase
MGGHHGIRHPRQYGSPGFEPLFRNLTIGDGRGLFKAISTVDQAGADDLVKTSIDGGINFFDTAGNYT